MDQKLVRQKIACLYLVALVAGLVSQPLLAAQKTFYAIAHMTNSIKTVDWAVSQGANGIEADLRFDETTQQPTVFQHSIGSQACDCTCYSLAPFISPSNICSHMDSPVAGGGVIGCKTSETAAKLLTHAASKGLALVVIDSKIDEGNFPQDEAKLKAAGTAVVATLIDSLFTKGYEGDVIIGAPYLAQFKYIESAASAANQSAYSDRIFFTIDGEGDNAKGVLDKLVTLSSNKRVYGTGISACSAAAYHSAVLTGVANENAGVVGMVYVWTIDKSSSIDGYILNGATGIMSNEPKLAVEAATRNGLKLAKSGVRNQIPGATSNTVVKAPTLACDCDYSAGGCKISAAAPAGWACDCSYKGGWTCGGSVVACGDNASPKCVKPDTSFTACLQGQGDCGGYSGSDDCDCDYHSGGCTISKAAPAHSACKCSYKGGWTCGGKVAKCTDENSPKCKKPDMTEAACKLAAGSDCGGY